MILSKAEGIGCIQKCECGAIKVQCGFATLHLDEALFLAFANMVEEAASTVKGELLNKLFLGDADPENNSRMEF